jgi:hypothetical protein
VVRETPQSVTFKNDSMLSVNFSESLAERVSVEVGSIVLFSFSVYSALVF